MKPFIYLIQGQAKRIKNYLPLKDRSDIDVILLTYDEPMAEAIYFPNSTWGQGRNLLLEKALETGELYQYYIFLDDDVRFIKGGFATFEAHLKKHQPAIGMPVFSPKTEASVLGVGISFLHKFFIPLSPYQLCRQGDAQLMAFHQDVIADRLVVPLQTHFDDLSWHATSSTQQLLMLNLYQDAILQFNNIVVANDVHGQYPNNHFKEAQQAWFTEQFVEPIHDPRQDVFNLLSRQGLKTRNKSTRDSLQRSMRRFIRLIRDTLTYQPQAHYHIPPKKVKTILRQKSALLAQYLAATNTILADPSIDLNGIK